MHGVTQDKRGWLARRWDRIAQKRVARGVHWLDLHGPMAWWMKVRPNQLNLWSSNDCVLGQVYGHTKNAPITPWVSVGFLSLFLRRRITREWQRVILERRGG
jgi:hypothetical protein